MCCRAVESQIKNLLAGRAYESAVVATSALSFSPDLLAACKTNVCGHYNTSWTCPPAFSAEEQRQAILSWPFAFVFTTKSDLEDSFDYEGMCEARDRHNAITAELRESLQLPVYGAGSCPWCKPCRYPEPCSFPQKKIYSLEAAGIDVTALSRTAGIHYNNGPNTVSYFSMILFDTKAEDAHG